jgi:DNA-binding response OmpR family regulator
VPDVLVVDDDRAARESLGPALLREGLEVREAADGLSALDAITADPAATVALDVGLSGLAGAEVVRTIGAQRRTLPALARHAGRTLTRGRLLARVWGYTWEVGGEVVDVIFEGLGRRLDAGGESRVAGHLPGDRFVVTA